MTRDRKKILRSVTVPNSIVFFEDIILKMKEDGYETVVVTSPGKDLDDFEIRNPDFRTVRLPMERHISILKDFISLLRMIKIMIRERPYMVHSMTPKAGLLTMLAAWMTQVPVRVHTFTGLIWPTSVGYKRKLLLLMDKLLCSCATHVIPEGYGVLNDLRNYRVCKKPMRVLGYGNVKGVDLEYFNPTRFKKTNIKSPFTFLFVGRIVRDKGINELVKAFADLYKKHKNTQLILVGNIEAGLDPISDATRQIISTCDAIKLCGPKYGEDLLQMYVDADCFVMPSYREGFPNAVIEAGAMGMPSIVTDVNGSREIIIEGENGFIVPPRTATILCEAMEKVLVDNELRESMRKKARMLIESRFEKSFVQRCLMEYYREIL